MTTRERRVTQIAGILAIASCVVSVLSIFVLHSVMVSLIGWLLAAISLSYSGLAYRARQRMRSQRRAHVRDLFERVQQAGCIVRDDSTIDGIRYGDLRQERRT